MHVVPKSLILHQTWRVWYYTRERKIVCFYWSPFSPFFLDFDNSNNLDTSIGTIQLQMPGPSINDGNSFSDFLNPPLYFPVESVDSVIMVLRLNPEIAELLFSYFMDKISYFHRINLEHQYDIWWRWKPETNRNVVFLKEI